MMHECAAENHHERQPVFPPVRPPRRSAPARDRNARRPAHQLWRPHGPGRADGECAGVERRQAGRPCRRANRKIGAGPGAVSRRGARRRGLPAAQHRLHAERTGIFHQRRRTVAGGVRSIKGRRHRRHRRQGRRQGHDARRRRQGIADRCRRHGAPGVRDHRPRRRRPRRDPLHLGHDRAFQGRDADARQPCVEFALAGRLLALHRPGRADPRAADLSHPRPVRGQQRHAVRARLDDLPAEIRSRAGHQADGARHRADGRADILHAAAAKPGADPRSRQAHAAVHFGLGAAACRHPSRMVGAHRSCRTRALRHDRNQHEHLEPL